MQKNDKEAVIYTRGKKKITVRIVENGDRYGYKNFAINDYGKTLVIFEGQEGWRAPQFFAEDMESIRGELEFRRDFDPWAWPEPFDTSSLTIIEMEDMAQVLFMLKKIKNAKRKKAYKEKLKTIKLNKDKLNDIRVNKVIIEDPEGGGLDQVWLENSGSVWSEHNQSIDLINDKVLNFKTDHDPNSLYYFRIYQSKNGTWFTFIRDELTRVEESYRPLLDGPCPFCSVEEDVKNQFHECEVLRNNKKQVIDAILSFVDTRLSLLMQFPEGIRLVDNRKTREELNL